MKIKKHPSTWTLNYLFNVSDGCKEILDNSPNIPLVNLPMIILSEEITDHAQLSNIINSLEAGAVLEQCMEAEKPKTQQLAPVEYSDLDKDFVDIDNLFEDLDHPLTGNETNKENNSNLTNDESVAFKRVSTSKINVLQSNKSCLLIKSKQSTSKESHSPDSLPIKLNPLKRLEKYQRTI